MGRTRVAAAVVVVPLLASLAGAPFAGPAMAQPTPTPSATGEVEIEVPPAVPGEPVCTIADFRFRALSGMAALADGSFAVVNHGGQQFASQPIFFLNPDCQFIGETRFPSPSLDPEDMAYDADEGVLWVGDIGDNFDDTGVQPRPTVAFWRVDLNGDRNPVIHRFAYPDGPHDAEALILDGDGTPIIITKNIGTAELYRPAAPMVPDNPPEQAVMLERVGEFTPPDTGTEHAFGRVARQVITGGANSPDGERVVLRTYTDALEFDVTDGDVVGAITTGTPRVTPLPDEPLGEAIAYTPDGEHFVTVSEAPEEGVNPAILRYTPSPPAPEPPPQEEVAAPPLSNRSLLDRLGPQGIINLIGAVGVVGLIMVGIGVFGIVRARRAARDEEDEDEDLDEDEREGAEYDAYQGHERVGPPGGVTARAWVTTPPDGTLPAPPPGSGHPGWERGAGQPPGVYAARPGTYGGNQPEHPGAGHPGAGHPGAGHPGAGHPGAPAVPGHGGAPRRGGTVYSAGAGYQEHPFDQDHPAGYPDAASGHQEGYQSGQHGGHQGGPRGGQQDPRYAPPPEEPGATYRGGVYRHNPDEVPDYYSDDPDYPYEFRDRGDY